MSLFGGPAHAAPYDTVLCTDADGERRLTRAEFEKLPLVNRVRLLAGGGLRFYRGADEVEKSVALARR